MDILVGNGHGDKRLFVFYIVLIPFEKVSIQLFFLQL